MHPTTVLSSRMSSLLRPASYYSSIISEFRAPICYSIAYGSSVFAQSPRNEHATRAQDPHKMIDFIFGVTHPEHWHQLNMQQNPFHYSKGAQWLSKIHGAIENLQTSGAGVWYNAFVRMKGNDVLFKYGVVGVNRMIEDLNHWRDFYLAGRLQKPVLIIRSDSRLRLANLTNRCNALRLTCLLLGEHSCVPEDVFLQTLTGLSFEGDFRARLRGLEDPRKVCKVVREQVEDFRDIYGEDVRFELRDLMDWDTSRGTIVMATDPGVRARHFGKLPESFKRRVFASMMLPVAPTGTDASKAASDALARPDVVYHLKAALVGISYWPTVRQSAKGLITAGVLNSSAYVLRKLRKGRTGLAQSRGSG